MSANVTACKDLANCFALAGMYSYNNYVPSLLGDRFGLTIEGYKGFAIAFPVVTSAGFYLVLWIKSYGESRRYLDMPEPFFTKWSWTKISANLGIPVVALQLALSIPKPVPEATDDFNTFIRSMDSYATYFCGVTPNPATHLSEINASSFSPLLIDSVTNRLSQMPTWFGATSLALSILMGLQLLVSCLENKRFGKRDALAITFIVTNAALGAFQLLKAKENDFGDRFLVGQDVCRARYAIEG